MAAAPRDVSRILKKHHYTEIKKIGEGSFGKAILVQADDGSKLVCKMVNISQASAKELEDARKEGRLLAAFKHPFIVQYRENFIDSGWLCILMAYCEGGDLTSQIELARKAQKPIPEEQVLRWMTQALLALKYIHDRHVLHRDLKSGNFFLSKSGNLKMGDFGIARVLNCTAACAQTQIGTPYYLSPEVCQEKPYTWPSDIWAMGCILYELCALKVPFEAPNMIALVQKICRGPTPSVPDAYSGFTRQLCTEMLSRNPACRPSAEAILQRPRIQAIVKQMFEQAQLAQERREPGAEEEGRGSRAGAYQRGDAVEYYSNTHKDWIPATVVNADGDGRIVIDVKPNTWITPEQQAQQVRRRGAPDASSTQERAMPVPSCRASGEDGVDAKEPEEPRAASNAGDLSALQELDEEYSKLCEELGIEQTACAPLRAGGHSAKEALEAPQESAVPEAPEAHELPVLREDQIDSSCSLTAAELELLVDPETPPLDAVSRAVA